MQPVLLNLSAAAGTDRELRVLHLEDSDLDHELMRAHLARGGLQVQLQRIDSEAAFLGALERNWDAILSDYNLPGFSGLVALDLLKASGRDVPFILVSGEIGEDTAVEAMRNGASDYLLKNNLSRLVPALLMRSRRPTRSVRATAPTASSMPPNSACANLPSTCRAASNSSAPRLRARSTTTSAARSPR